MSSPAPNSPPAADSALAAAFAVVGDDGIARLVAAFYRRVPADPVLGPMYPPDELPAAEARLRDFLRFRFGGRPEYLARRGPPRLKMRHAPFAIGLEARDHWIALMNAAFEDVAFPPAAEAPLRAFLESVATFLVNRPPG